MTTEACPERIPVNRQTTPRARIARHTITRRSLLVIAVFSACASIMIQPAAAATREAAAGPRAIIKTIYSQEGSLNLPAAERHEYFSKSVVALWAKSDAESGAGDIGSIDFDLESNSQGMAIASYTVKTVRAEATHVTLVVSLVSRGDWIRNSPSDLIIRYDFIREGGRWVIDDMSSTADGKPWTLRGLLESAI
jgi:hypothetical protein